MGFEFSAFRMKYKLLWPDYAMIVTLTIVWLMCIPYLIMGAWLALGFEFALSVSYTWYVVTRIRQLKGL